MALASLRKMALPHSWSRSDVNWYHFHFRKAQSASSHSLSVHGTAGRGVCGRHRSAATPRNGRGRRKPAESSAPGVARGAAQRLELAERPVSSERAGSRVWAAVGAGARGQAGGQPGPSLTPCPGSHASAHCARTRKDAGTAGLACPGSQARPLSPSAPASREGASSGR